MTIATAPKPAFDGSRGEGVATPAVGIAIAPMVHPVNMNLGPDGGIVLASRRAFGRSRMTACDAVMIGLVVAGMIWGSIRGFSWQIASIGSLVVGYFGAHQISAYMLPFLALYQPGDPAIQRGTAMLLAYLVISGGV